MSTPTKPTATTARRLDELKTMLADRRAALVSEVHERIRDVRADSSVDRDGVDEAETAAVSVQDDIGFALIQLKAETLDKIDDALRRIDAGHYGDCSNCEAGISEARLRALPFALRCKECEEAREAAARQRRSLARSGAAALLGDRG
jgi:DnaK suppressor protein